jgi:hypothetical protein
LLNILKISFFFSLTYKEKSTLFHPVKFAQKPPTCKILLDMVWVSVNVYDTSSTSINDPDEVAMILNE